MGFRVWGIFFLGTAFLFAEKAALVDNPLVPEELIADQQDYVPSILPIHFTSFRYPHLDRLGNVTFIADDPYYRGGEKFGIYRSDGRTGKLTKLVNNDDFAPGTQLRFTDFLGLQLDESQFVFWARLSDGSTGVFGDRGAGMERFADTRTVATPAQAMFKSFAYADMNQGSVVFVGKDSNDVTGLFLLERRESQVRRLVDQSTVLPDGSTIKRFNGQPWMDTRSIVFRATDSTGHPALYRITRSSVSEKVSIEILINHNTKLPVPVTLNEFRSAPVEGDRVVFSASGKDADGSAYTGIFEWNRGVLSVVVDNHTEIPEEGIQFLSFNKWIALQDGWIIFRGDGKTGFEGLFAYDTRAAELQVLFSNRNKIGGRQVKEFEIASNPIVGSHVAFLALFEDGWDSIYFASLKQGPAKD